MDEQKRANGLWEQFYSGFAPYMNHTAYDITGEERPTDGRVFLRGKSEENIDPLMMKIFVMSKDFDGRPAKFDQSVRLPEGGSVKVNLKADQWDDYHKFLRDTNVRQKLQEYIDSDYAMTNFNTGRLDRNTTEVQTIISQSRATALQRVIEKYPDLMQDVKEKERKKRGTDAMRPPMPAGAADILEFRGGQ
jgi:hypothetical protein